MNSLERKELTKIEGLLLEAVSAMVAECGSPSQLTFQEAKTLEAYFCLKHVMNRGAEMVPTYPNRES